MTRQLAAPPTVRGDDWLVRQLPAGMVAEDFFVRFVRIFQEQGSTLLAHADALPYLVDPRLAPTEMVRYMSRWLGMPDVDGSYGEDAQRAVLLTASATLQWRGTPVGLLRLLELYSDGPVVVEEGGGVWAQGEAPDDTAWVRIEVASSGPLEESDLLTRVLDEIPAQVRAEITVAGRRVWPPADREDR